MKIPLTLQPPSLAAQPQVQSLLQQLRVGQVLQAKVLAQVQPAVIKLQIATTELLARTPVTLEPGTRLRLEVMQREPQPALRILNREQSPLPPARDRVMRNAMPRQQLPIVTRQALQDLRAVASTQRQAEPIERAIRILSDSAVKPAQLTAGGIQRALTASGIFLETKLLSATLQAAPDLKLDLLKLLRTLTDRSRVVAADGKAAVDDAQYPSNSRSAGNDALLTRLVRLIEGAVARVQVHQAAALPVEDNARQVWQIDLPVQTDDGTDDIALRIERDDEAGKSAADGSWSVNLVFDFDTIGKVQSRIGLNGDSVAVSFWCASDSAHNRLQQRLPVLERALKAQGLEVIHLSGAVGEPEDPSFRGTARSTLLDERA